MATVARSGVARCGDTRSGDTSAATTDFTPTLSMVIGGTSRIQNMDISDLSIGMGLNSEPSELTARVVARGNFTIAEGEEVRAYLGGDQVGVPLFAGNILRVTDAFNRQDDYIEYAIEASDFRWLLDRYALVSEFYWNKGVNTIIAHLLANYADPASGFRPGYTPSSLGTVEFIEFDNLRITECLERLAKTVDGGAFWQVDAEKVVHMYGEPDDEANTITVADNGDFRHFRRERDVAPVVNRVIFIGGGSQSTEVAEVGATTITVEELGWFNPAGGSVRCPCNTVTYTGKSAGSGMGTLTGVSGISHDVPQGTQIYNLYQADDTTAQTALASTLGGGQSGIAAYEDSDHRFGYDRTEEAAEGLLDILSSPNTSIEYDITPDATTAYRTHIRPGRVVSVSLTAPESISGSYRVRRVNLTPHARGADGSLTFARRVQASTNKRTVIEAFKEALA